MSGADGFDDEFDSDPNPRPPVPTPPPKVPPRDRAAEAAMRALGRTSPTYEQVLEFMKKQWPEKYREDHPKTDEEK